MYDFLISYDSLVNDIMVTNATYLGISILVILGTGAAFYIFNLKPFQDAAQKSAAEIKELALKNIELFKQNEELKTELSKNIATQKRIFKSKLDSFENRFGEIEDKVQSATDSLKEDVKNYNLQLKKLVSETEQEIKKIEWQSEWNLHYIWEARQVHFNTITTLMSALRLSIDLKEDWRTDLVINGVYTNIHRNIDDLKSDSDWPELKTKITTAITPFKEQDNAKKILALIE